MQPESRIDQQWKNEFFIIMFPEKEPNNHEFSPLMNLYLRRERKTSVLFFLGGRLSALFCKKNDNKLQNCQDYNIARTCAVARHEPLVKFKVSRLLKILKWLVGLQNEKNALVLPKIWKEMASKSGPIPAGTDGHDYMHRQKIAEQYFIRWVRDCLQLLSYFRNFLVAVIKAASWFRSS